MDALVPHSIFTENQRLIEHKYPIRRHEIELTVAPPTTPYGDPTLEAMRGRMNGLEPRSNFTGNQRLLAHEHPIRRHEIALTAGSRKVLEYFFTQEEIQVAEDQRHVKAETVPFYLVRTHPEICMGFGKRKKMKTFLKDESGWLKYKALVEYGLFHDEIMDSLAKSRGDFEVAIYDLLAVKISRTGQINVLRQKFTDAQVQDAMEECPKWSDVVYYLMTQNSPHREDSIFMKPLDGQLLRYTARFEEDGCLQFYETLYAFGFTSQAIISNWMVCADWKLIPYNLLSRNTQY